jgi:hypothetical protein
MATNFPGALDALTNPTPTSDTVTVPHSTQHANANDAIEALEAKVGVNASGVTTSHDYKLGEVTAADKAVGKTATQVMTNKTLGTGSKILVGSDATGDTYYNSGAGTIARRAIGSEGQVQTVVGGVPAWQSPSATNSNYIVDTGVANAYIADLSPALGSYTAGTRVEFKALNANTTTSTVDVNGLGVKTIKKLGGATNLVSGDIAAGMIVELEYDGTNFVMLNPVANAPVIAVTDIQAFTTAGTTTWTKPAGAKWVEVTVMGGGGAGGSGSAASNSSAGAGGGWGYKRFDASVLGATESVTVGAAGVAGANNTPGGAGGFSSFGTTVLLRADGGNGGSGSATISGGSANGDIHYNGGNSGSTYSSAGLSTAIDPSPRAGGNGGYNGGSPATATAGGAGGGFTTYYVKAGGANGAAGVNNGTAGAATVAGLLYGGVGGGGGGYNGNGTNTGGNGGAGGFPGGGGGGSVGTNNTGGNGAVGIVHVVTYF